MEEKRSEKHFRTKRSRLGSIGTRLILAGLALAALTVAALVLTGAPGAVRLNATTATTATTAAPSPSEQAITASQWPETASTYITEAQAIDEVRAESTATGHALRTTYDRASAMLGDSGAQPNVNPDTVVWIVTVEGPAPYVSSPMAGPGPGAPTTMAPKFQSVVMDAANGGEIDSCLGCDSVTSG